MNDINGLGWRVYYILRFWSVGRGILSSVEDKAGGAKGGEQTFAAT